MKIKIDELKPMRGSSRPSKRLAALREIAQLQPGEAIRLPGMNRGSLAAYLTSAHRCGFALDCSCGIEVDGTPYVMRDTGGG